MGKEFVRLLSYEIDKLCSSEEKFERVIVCCGVALQSNHTVRKGADIRRLLRRIEA